jgi:hypothetical protein
MDAAREMTTAMRQQKLIDMELTRDNRRSPLRTNEEFQESAYRFLSKRSVPQAAPRPEGYCSEDNRMRRAGLLDNCSFRPIIAPHQFGL